MARIKVFDTNTQSWVYADKSFGKDGKSAYEYAQEGGYEGSETEFYSDLANGGGGVQPDWNQTDETAADYIKNKPFQSALVEVFPETEIVGNAYFEVVGLIGGEEFVVTVDGEAYKCALLNDTGGQFYYGNGVIFGLEENGLPFGMVVIPAYNNVYFVLTDEESHRVSVAVSFVEQLNEVYIPTLSLKKIFSNCIFFVKTNDIYIYKEPDCTTKVNMAEFPLGYPIFLSRNYGDGVQMQVLSYGHANRKETGASGFVFEVSDLGETAYYYSAEYVPETTT